MTAPFGGSILVAEDLAEIDHKNGTIRWKHGEKLPVGLIKKLVRYRVEQARIDDDPDPP